MTTTQRGGNATETYMSDETEDPEKAADRLEAALERIASLARSRPAVASAGTDADLTLREVQTSLDSLIERLRAGLTGRQDQA